VVWAKVGKIEKNWVSR